MKFILTISVCSFLNGECATSIKIPQYYNTWSQCVQSAIIYSEKILWQRIGVDKVNQYKLATKFSCQELRES